ELGTQLTPVLVDLYETVFPALVSGLERVIGLWNDWYFLIHGTTPELQRAQEQFESQFTPQQLAILDAIQFQRQRRGQLVSERAALVAAGATPEELAEIDAEIAETDTRIAGLQQRYRDLRQEAETTGRAVTGVATATNDLADANFNLNTAVKERPKDPLVEEAGRIQRDLQRLKLGFDQGNLSMREYVEHVEAHVRRLDGLYARATDPSQTLAILRARQAALQEIQRVMGDGRPPSDILGVPDAGGLAGQPTRRPESEAELRRM